MNMEETKERKEIEEAVELYRKMTEIQRAEVRGFIKCIRTMNGNAGESKKDMQMI